MRLHEVTDFMSRRKAQLDADEHKGQRFDEITGLWVDEMDPPGEQYAIMDEYGKGYAWADSYKEAERKVKELKLQGKGDLQIVPW